MQRVFLLVRQDVSSICQYCDMVSMDRLAPMVFGEIKKKITRKPAIKNRR